MGLLSLGRRKTGPENREIANSTDLALWTAHPADSQDRKEAGKPFRFENPAAAIDKPSNVRKRAMIPTIAVVLASILILWWSRKSLLHPSSHGFPRFFAFEAILILVVLNLPHWFNHPFDTLQILSWLLLVVSIVPVIWGFVLLRRHGESRPPTDGSAVFEWENTNHLVTTGIYRYIRHPMYSSLLFLTWGAFLKFVTLVTFSLAVFATIAVIFAAKAEETENIARFGEDYRNYMKQTWRFVPFF